MDAITAVTDTLDRAVESEQLVGYVCGVRADGQSRIAAGGSREAGGPRMLADSIFPLSSNTKPLGGVLAMALVQQGILDLDAPINGYLPELDDLRVLSNPDGPLDDTVPLARKISLRHLLTMTAGFGWAGENPALAEAMSVREIAPGPYAPPVEPGTYLRRLAELPLVGQPGQGWWYHTCSDVLGVLLERAAGTSVPGLMEEYVTGPLGLLDTGFTADPERLVTSYGAGQDGVAEQVEVPGGFACPPVFAALACGMASTVGDYLTFLEALIDGGQVLAWNRAGLLATDQLTEPQRQAARGFLEPGCGYGFQVEVRPGGAVGWAGGLGTIGYVNRHTRRSAAVFTSQSFDVRGTQEALNEVWRLLA